MATNPMVKFRFGEYAGFKSLATWEAGALYITTDEQGMYFSKDGQKPVKLGNIITYESLKDFTDSTKPPYSADVFYYVTESNALLKYNGTKFVQLNKDYGSDVAGLLEAVGSKDDNVETKETLWAYINKAQAKADAAASAASIADGKAAAAATTAESALSKANANAGGISTLQSGLNTANGKITDLEAIVVNGDNSNAKLREAISAAASAAATADGKAVAAQSAAEAAAADAATADGKAATAKGVADQALAKAGENAEAIEAINTALGSDDATGSVKERLTAVETKAATNASDITTIKSTYATTAAMNSAIGAAKTEVNGYTNQAVAGAKTELIGEEVTGVTTTIKGVKKYADEQIASVTSALNTLKSDIGNLANVMNFRGTFDKFEDVSEPVNGDVIIIDGVEYVYVKESAEATGVWEQIGATTVTDSRFEAIEEAAEALEARVTALDKEGGRVALVEGVASAAQSKAAANETAIGVEKGRVDTLVNTTIPGIEAKIGTVESGKNLAKMIADEASRAAGVEGGLNTRLNTLENTTIPGINTAHNTLKGRVDLLDGETGRVAVAEGKITALESKVGTVAGGKNLAQMIADETSRASGQEAAIRSEFAAADAVLKTQIEALLTWSSWDAPQA